jgi:hypothetical protein
MAIGITVTPAAPVSTVDSARVDLAGLDNSTEVYIAVTASGVDEAESQVFVGASDGTGLLFEHIFPSAGNYTVAVNAASNDAQLASTAVTVS